MKKADELVTLDRRKAAKKEKERTHLLTENIIFRVMKEVVPFGMRDTRKPVGSFEKKKENLDPVR